MKTAKQILDDVIVGMPDDKMKECIISAMESYAIEYHQSTLKTNSTGERTYTVDEILKELRPFQSAENAMAWFDRYGR